MPWPKIRRHTTLATVSHYKITCTRAHDLSGKTSVTALAVPFVLGSARDSAKQRQRTTREHQQPHPRGALIGRLSASGEAAQLSALAYQTQTVLRGRASRLHQQSHSQRRFDRVSDDLLSPVLGRDCCGIYDYAMTIRPNLHRKRSSRSRRSQDLTSQKEVGHDSRLSVASSM